MSSNYIPNKTVLCDDKDLPWITNGMRAVIKMKNNAHEKYIRSGTRHNYYVCLENLIIELLNLIHSTKTEYWSILVKQNWSLLVVVPKHTGEFWKLLSVVGKFLWYPHYWLIMNLFVILRLKLIISTDSLTNTVQQFPLKFLILLY